MLAARLVGLRAAAGCQPRVLMQQLHSTPVLYKGRRTGSKAHLPTFRWKAKPKRVYALHTKLGKRHGVPGSRMKKAIDKGDLATLLGPKEAERKVRELLGLDQFGKFHDDVDLLEGTMAGDLAIVGGTLGLRPKSVSNIDVDVRLPMQPGPRLLPSVYGAVEPQSTAAQLFLCEGRPDHKAAYVDARLLFRVMALEQEGKPPPYAYLSLLKSAANAGNLEDSLTIVDEMYFAHPMELAQSDVATHAVTALVEVCAANKRLAMAWQIWDVTFETNLLHPAPTEEAFNAMIKCCQYAFTPERALKLLDQMTSLRVRRTADTYAALLKACAEAPQWHSAYGFLSDEVLDQMESDGILPTKGIYVALVRCCGRAGDARSAKWYFDEMVERQGWRADQRDLAELFRGLARCNTVGLTKGTRPRYLPVAPWEHLGPSAHPDNLTPEDTDCSPERFARYYSDEHILGEQGAQKKSVRTRSAVRSDYDDPMPSDPLPMQSNFQAFLDGEDHEDYEDNYGHGFDDDDDDDEDDYEGFDAPEDYIGEELPADQMSELIGDGAYFDGSRDRKRLNAAGIGGFDRFDDGALDEETAKMMKEMGLVDDPNELTEADIERLVDEATGKSNPYGEPSDDELKDIFAAMPRALREDGKQSTKEDYEAFQQKVPGLVKGKQTGTTEAKFPRGKKAEAKGPLGREGGDDAVDVDVEDEAAWKESAAQRAEAFEAMLGQRQAPAPPAMKQRAVIDLGGAAEAPAAPAAPAPAAPAPPAKPSGKKKRSVIDLSPAAEEKLPFGMQPLKPWERMVDGQRIIDFDILVSEKDKFLASVGDSGPSTPDFSEENDPEVQRLVDLAMAEEVDKAVAISKRAGSYNSSDPYEGAFGDQEEAFPLQLRARSFDPKILPDGTAVMPTAGISSVTRLRHLVHEKLGVDHGSITKRRNENVAFARGALDALEATGEKPTEEVMNAFLAMHTACGNDSPIRDVLEIDFAKHGIDTNSDNVLRLLVKRFVRRGQPDDARKTLDEMREPDMESVGATLDLFARKRRMKESFELCTMLNDVHQKRLLLGVGPGNTKPRMPLFADAMAEAMYPPAYYKNREREWGNKRYFGPPERLLKNFRLLCRREEVNQPSYLVLDPVFFRRGGIRKIMKKQGNKRLVEKRTWMRASKSY